MSLIKVSQRRETVPESQLINMTNRRIQMTPESEMLKEDKHAHLLTYLMTCSKGLQLEADCNMRESRWAFQSSMDRSHGAVASPP